MVTLHAEVMGGTDASHYVLFTHGIYGSGANWRSIARAVLERRPEYGAVLVDLRGHGRSPDGDPPHTLDACASDLAATITELSARRGGAPWRVTAACGHSFGGKVVMALRGLSASALTSYWVLDSTPSPRPTAAEDPSNLVAEVWRTLAALPVHWASREAFIAALVASGQAQSLAAWLAMNLVATPQDAEGTFRLRLSLPQMAALLEDYYQRDTWGDILAPGRGDVHMVVAMQSTVLSPADRARLGAAAASAPHLKVHYLNPCGHWLHIDQPTATAELIASGLPVLPP